MTRFCWRDGTGCPSSHRTKPRRTRRGARRVGTARDRAAVEVATWASRPAEDSLASARRSGCPAEGCSPGPWCVSVALVASCGDHSDSRHPVPPGESPQFGITHLDVEVAHGLRVRGDELLARLDVGAHQLLEDVVDGGRVLDL